MLAMGKESVVSLLRSHLPAITLIVGLLVLSSGCGGDGAPATGLSPDPASSLAGKTPRSHLDTADETIIEGWVWDPERPDAVIEVDIYDGEKPIATVAAGNLREDLVVEKIGDGRHSFSFATPADIKDGNRNMIHVFIAGTKTELQDSPKALTARIK